MAGISDWIVKDTNICGGEETIKGTRILYSTIKQYVESGATNGRIMIDYPSLPQESLDVIREHLGIEE